MGAHFLCATVKIGIRHLVFDVAARTIALYFNIDTQSHRSVTGRRLCERHKTGGYRQSRRLYSGAPGVLAA